jgi:hypothetical protein
MEEILRHSCSVTCGRTPMTTIRRWSCQTSCCKKVDYSRSSSWAEQQNSDQEYCEDKVFLHLSSASLWAWKNELKLRAPTLLVCRWCMWIWQSIHHRLWNEHSSAEHGSFRLRLEVWSLLHVDMQWTAMVRARSIRADCDGHQSVSSQLGAAQRQRRMVQSSSPALRPCRACLPPARCTHCWNCSCPLQTVNFLSRVSLKQVFWTGESSC